MLDSIARLPAAPPHLHVSPDGSWAWAEFTTFDADLWPRAMLRRTTLAAALGFTDEARFWYRRLADLWGQADPDFQQEVRGLRQTVPQ